MKVLVTSSTGLTGKAVVKGLARNGVEVRAMLHSSARASEMHALGAKETVIGEIELRRDLVRSMEGMDSVYYIAPTAREDEAEIGKMAIEAAKEAGIKRFIYQSVLHSIEPGLPHHRQILEVERALIDSGLEYSIVQPAPFMQNILNSKDALLNNKVFVQKFFINKESSNRINLIDVEDFGESVAEIVCNPRYIYSTLELCGPQNLSVTDILSSLEGVTGEKIDLRCISDEEIMNGMRAKGAAEYSVETLLEMFHHYNNGDFCGSLFISEAILRRKPTTFYDFLKREIK